MLKLRNKEIHISQGDDAAITIALTQNGEPYVLEEGDEVIFTMSKDVNSPYLIQKSITNAGGSSIILLLNKEDTSNIDSGFYLYELQIVYANGSQSKLVPPTIFEIMDVMKNGGYSGK